MRARKTPEQELEEKRAELADAEEKAARWNGRVEELQGEVRQMENTMILGAARSVFTTPEGLRNLLNLIRSMGTVPGTALGGNAAASDTRRKDVPPYAGNVKMGSEPSEQREGQPDEE